MELIYTKNPPTEPGWYRIKLPNDTKGFITLVDYPFPNKGELVWQFFDETNWRYTLRSVLEPSLEWVKEVHPYNAPVAQ